MVASDALMRLSLVISWPPGAKGTLKSTRIKTHLFFRSRSRTDSLGIRSSQRGLTLESSRMHRTSHWRSRSSSRWPCFFEIVQPVAVLLQDASEPLPRVHHLRQALLVGAERHVVGMEHLFVCTEPLLVGTEHLPVFLAGGLVHVRPQLQRLLQSLQSLIDGHANSICSFCTPRMQADKRTGTPFYLCAPVCICG